MENASWTTDKKRTWTRVSFQSKYSPEQIWEVLLHPKYAEELAVEKCFYIEIPKDFSLEKGKTYLEIHNGEHCKGDICQYKILESVPYKLHKVVKHQIGLKLTATYILTPNEKGTLITELNQYSISFKGFKLKYLLHWLLLHLGIMMKVINLDDDKKWFENVEKIIETRQ